MAEKKPKIPKTLYMTSAQSNRYSRVSTRHIGSGRRAMGVLTTAIALQPGRIHPGVRLGIAAAGIGLYAHGKVAQLRARRAHNTSVRKSGHTVTIFSQHKKTGAIASQSVRIKVNDRLAHRQQGTKPPAKTANGAKMSRSQAARVAAMARWRGGGKRR